MITQFEILRDEVWSTLERAVLQSLTPTDVFALGRVLNASLDAVMFQIAQEYSAPPAPGVTVGSSR